MGNTRDTGYLRNLVAYDGSGNITLPANLTVTGSIIGYVPTSRTITINGTSYDLTANRSWNITSMIYPGAGIAVSTGSAWGTSITDNSSNWNTAFGWGNHASAGYLTSALAATTYASLTGSYANPSWITSLAYSKITGVPAFITSYTETDTLATVTGRGASTSTAVTFSGGASISNLLINGAPSVAESSLALGAMGTAEGGQLTLNKATSYTYAAHIDVWNDSLRFLYGTNTATSGVAMSVNLSNRQLILPLYTTSTSFTGTAAGVLAFDSSGNIITIAVPSGGGAVSSVNAGTGVSVNATTGAVTVSIGQSVATSATPSFDQVITTNNGNGTNFRIGDDAWIGDINAANTFRVQGLQDATQGYIVFGNSNATALGRSGTGALTYGGNTIYHAGNLTNLNQLTNGPGYITGYTETDPYRVTAVAVSGTSTKTITLTRADSSTVTTTWTDIDTDTNTYATTLGFSGGTLTLTNNNASTVTVSLDGRYYLATNPSSYITSSSLTSYVPYTGATANIDTGGYSITAGAVTLTSNLWLKNIGTYDFIMSNGTSLTTNTIRAYYNTSDELRFYAKNTAGSAVVPKIMVGDGTTFYTLYHSANIPTWNQNTTGTASNITAYTINQNLGTASDPTFNSVYFANGNLRLYQGDGTALRIVTAYGYINIGAQNGSWSHIYSDKSFYFNQELYINNVQVVKNSGTWGISVTGNAATVTNATFYRQFTVRDDRSDGSDYSLAARATGLYAINSTGTNGPGYGYLSLIHVANGNDVAFQIAGGYNSDAMYFRGTYALQNGTGYSAWRTVIHSGNIGSQSVNYAATAGNITAYTINQSVGTGNAPTFAGLTINTGGTGTWGPFVVTSTSLWGDGATQYVTIGAGGAAGIMIYNPHIVWNAGESVAAAKYGRSGGISSGAYYVAGTGASDNFFIAKNGLINSPQFNINTSGNATFSGTISASNLSGTNTGDQTNISGNAATATSAGYSDYVAAQTNPVGNFNVGLSRPKGASYTTTASTVTGAIKIKLPPGTPVHGMWKMTVKIYEYGQRGNGYTIELGCHLYPSTAYNRYQWMLTTDTGAVLPIRYGTDGSSGCVWIGENGTTWSYPQVHVTEFSNGYNNPGGVNWTTGTWGVTIGAIDNSVAVDGPYTTSLIAAAYATSAGSATYATNSTRLYASDGTYVYGGGAPYYMYMTYDGGSYWELKVSPATPGAVRVAYANSAGSAGNASTVGNISASSFVRNDTTSQYLKPYYEYGNYLTTESPATLKNQMGGGGLRVDFMNPSYAGGGSWNHVITWSGYQAYNMYQLGGYYDGGTTTNLYVRSEANHGNTSWTSWRRLLNETADPYAVNMNQYVRTSDAPTFTNIYNNAWFRNNNVNEGVYNQATGVHFYSGSATGWTVTGAGSNVELIFRSNHQTTIRGYVYGDTNSNFGLLDNTGNWQVRLNPSNNGGQLYGNWLFSGAIRRNAHAAGFLEGSYNNIGGNSDRTNPIYTIGSSYNPTDTSLSNMYGIGYAHPNLWGGGKTPSWGLYVCEGGGINATIGGGAVTIWAQNDIVAYSDIRVKDNIEVVTNAIEKIQAIRGVTFTRKDASLEDKDKRHAGVIAQEVLKVMPEVVTGTEKDMYSVAYGNMAALFIEAIKEQQLQIEELKKQIEYLVENK